MFDSFQLIFVHGVKCQTSLLCLWISSFPTTFFEKTALSPIECSWLVLFLLLVSFHCVDTDHVVFIYPCPGSWTLGSLPVFGSSCRCEHLRTSFWMADIFVSLGQKPGRGITGHMRTASFNFVRNHNFHSPSSSAGEDSFCLPCHQRLVCSSLCGRLFRFRGRSGCALWGDFASLKQLTRSLSGGGVLWLQPHPSRPPPLPTTGFQLGQPQS